MAVQTVEKRCSVCGVNVADRPRTKDQAGHYFCGPCWQARVAEHASSAQSSPQPPRPKRKTPATPVSSDEALYDLAAFAPIAGVPADYKCSVCRGRFDPDDVYDDHGNIICKRCAEQASRAATPLPPWPGVPPIRAQQVAYRAPVGTVSVESHKGKAIAAMVLALVGLVSYCGTVILGVLAISFAAAALSGMSRNGNSAGKGMAITGLVIGIIDVLAGIVILLAVLAAQ